MWPILAARIPQFETIRLTHSWVGHYEMNTFDHNAILGPHPDVGNYLFINGFSGHGLQQAPAMGRGLAEWLCFGAYRTLDLGGFHFDRLLSGAPQAEKGSDLKRINFKPDTAFRGAGRGRSPDRGRRP